MRMRASHCWYQKVEKQTTKMKREVVLLRRYLKVSRAAVAVIKKTRKLEIFHLKS